MSRVITVHDPVDRFTTGTVGVPGERAFFLQVRSARGLSSMLVEKSQVQALAERLRILLRELRVDGLASIDELTLSHIRDSATLDFPIEEDFRIGIIGISWDETIQRVVIDIQAESPQGVEDLLDDDEAELLEDAPELVRSYIRIHQARTFIDRARGVVNAGREPCPFCGLPINVDGHLCPRENGYRR